MTPREDTVGRSDETMLNAQVRKASRIESVQDLSRCDPTPGLVGRLGRRGPQSNAPAVHHIKGILIPPHDGGLYQVVEGHEIDRNDGLVVEQELLSAL